MEPFEFQYTFRKHQTMMLAEFEHKRKQNRKKKFKFHLVSPPGSGKTVVGLEMAIRIGKPLLVVCPNTAIQGQWENKLEMFLELKDKNVLKDLVSTEASHVRQINIFTYQMLSVPAKEDDSLIRVSENLWAESISNALGISLEDAFHRINTMKETNPVAYASEISKYNKKLRKEFINDPDCSIARVVHPNTANLIKRLKENKTGTVVFDECHHLQSYWALIMREMVQEIGATNLIGLTATPPIDIEREKLECYTALLGEIDYQIPTPAVVKEGMLAPYQELVYFCMPTEKEFQYIQESHHKLEEIIGKFDQKVTEFYYWIYGRIVQRKLLSGQTQDWVHFINSRPSFAVAGVKYLLKHQCKLPWEITITEDMYEPMVFSDWKCLIEDYALGVLKLSPKNEDMVLYADIKEALKNLGYILTETGIRSYSSPIDRVLAYSKSKLKGVKKILRAETDALGDAIRATIITDFETSNVLSLKKIGSIMDPECGGAVSVIKELVSDQDMRSLCPVMLTAKSLLCHADVAGLFMAKGMQWAQGNAMDINLTVLPTEIEGLASVCGSGKDWNSRAAVLLTTFLFEQGAIKCIVGTRGLLSEGWDSPELNTLIDLTAVTTFTSVNQLRGRSIRKSGKDSLKVSNNWDVICIAPGLQKGYNDLNRLYRKHEQYYGVCDDGQIQKGIHHLDPSIYSYEEQLKEEDMERINQNMMEVVKDRKRTYQLWNIGAPFDNIELGCCEIKIGKPIQMKVGSVFGNEASVLRSKIKWCIAKGSGAVLSMAGGITLGFFSTPALIPALGLFTWAGVGTYRACKDIWRYGKENFFKLAVKAAVLDISKCLLHALTECGIIDPAICEEKIVVTERLDGTVRVYLDGYDEESEVFSNSLAQIFSPIENQRYAIQRYEVFVPKGSFQKMGYLFRYGMDQYSPILTCYHPLPEVFNIKEKARVFQKYWNKFVSPGELVFLKGEKGRVIIEKYGRVDVLGVKKRKMRVWK